MATVERPLASIPEEWAHYHTMYRELRASWPVVPYQEEIRWLSLREGLVVGDFGCGEALIAAAVKDRHRTMVAYRLMVSARRAGQRSVFSARCSRPGGLETPSALEGAPPGRGSPRCPRNCDTLRDSIDGAC